MPKILQDEACAKYFSEIHNPSPLFGLILATLHPPPPALYSSYSAFRTSLISSLHRAEVASTDYIIYLPDALHCTIATLHSFTSAPPPDTDCTIKAWGRVMDKITELPGWQAVERRNDASLRLKRAQVFDDGVVVLLYEDCGQVISTLRSSLQSMLESGTAVDGDVDWKNVRIPRICHSTVLRWRAAPGITTEDLQGMVDVAFEKAFAGLQDVAVAEVKLLNESLPYMQNRKCCKVAGIGVKKDGNREAC